MLKWHRRCGDLGVAVKVELEKALDKMGWSFSRDMMIPKHTYWILGSLNGRMFLGSSKWR